MIIEFEGRTWEFDPATINVDEWRQFKRVYQMTPSKFEEGVKEGDPDAYTFLYWIMLRRSGNQLISLGDHLKPDIIALNAAVAAATEDEPGPVPEPEAPPVPTSPPVSAASPAPASPPTTTPPSSPAVSGPAGQANGGTVTSSSSAPSTSVFSPASATSTNPGSASSP